MLRLDIPITKVDAAQRLVYGLATAEVPDRSGEICDYASTKPLYEKWSEAIAASSGGKSFGNLRAMHGAVAAGKVTALAFNDAAKQIEICAKVVDDAEWSKVEEGVYTGFSQGGAYARRWTDASGAKRYTAEPHEISLVDLPCLAEARFEMIKADGSHEASCVQGGRRPIPTFQSSDGPWFPCPSQADLGKVGARNNAEDQTRIQTMHDTAVELGATCGMDKSDRPHRRPTSARSTRPPASSSSRSAIIGVAPREDCRRSRRRGSRQSSDNRCRCPIASTSARAVGKGDDALDEDRVTRDARRPAQPSRCSRSSWRSGRGR